MADITIRALEQADLKPAWSLITANAPEYPPPSWPRTMAETQRVAFLHPRSRREGSLAAEEGGRLVGCMVFHYYPEEASAPVIFLAVDKKARRAGVGRALMAAWEDNARAVGAARLWAPEAPEEDERLLAFVNSFGMTRVGTIRSWVKRDEPTREPEPDERIVPMVNVPLAEVTQAFNDCFPRTPRTQEDLYALITQTRWGPWASLAYVEGNRVLAFLFTTDRAGRPYLQHIGTRAEARRRGLALKLLTNALFILRQGGAREVECEVGEGNEQAEKLAAAVGMKPGRRRIAFVKELA